MLTDLQKLLLEKVEQGRQKTRSLVKTSTLETNFKRPVYYGLADSLENFLDDKTSRSRWTIITGLRGVGKTTLLAQLYLHPALENCAKFYLSLDDVHAAGATIDDIVAVLEYRLKTRVSANKSPVFIFLDEVHFLPQWSLATKVLFDNSRNLFLICTGSSAISFWANPDIGRRAKMISLPPFSLQEFAGIEGLYHKIAWARFEAPDYPPKLTPPTIDIDLSERLKQAMFEAESAQDAYERLKQTESEMDKDKHNPSTIDDYVNFYGSLPYAAEIKHQKNYYYNEISNEIHGPPEPGYKLSKRPAGDEIRERVFQTLNTLFLRDLEVLGKFDPRTKTKFLRLLLMLANAGEINLRKIAKNLRLNVLTVQNMLKALGDGEIISPVAPSGASLGKIAKPYKYFFSSPGLRQGLSSLRLYPNEKIDSGDSSRLRGQLLEETVAMYLKRLFVGQATAGLIEYDARSGGADFIVMPQGLKSGAVIVEVGYNKTTARQVANTLNHFRGRYGLVITDLDLKIDDKNKTVFVPLRTFLML